MPDFIVVKGQRFPLPLANFIPWPNFSEKESYICTGRADYCRKPFRHLPLEQQREKH